MKLVFATHNIHKLREIRNLLGENIQLLSLDDIGCREELPEHHLTLEDNASGKAWFIYTRYGMDVFADDTGLEIDALNGEPGVFSARYAGVSKNPENNIDEVLSKMQGVKNRNARFRTVISLIHGGSEIIFEGTVAGTILESRQGTSGFGYDPVFLPDGFEKSFAEMSLGEKNIISHRAIAFKKLVKYLNAL